MSDNGTRRTSTGVGSEAVPRPPCRPPLELIEADGEWLVREYRRDQADVTTFAAYDRRIDAMRAGQGRMNADRHPCLLRWDAPDIVGDIYWNELFERLVVEWSRMLDAWVVVPDGEPVVFHAASDLESAYETGKTVLREYDFKRLVVRDGDGTTETTVEHRFLRHGIAESGVRFDRERLPAKSAEETPTDENGETDPDPPDIGPATPSSTLMAAIPDLTQLEELDTAGYVHRYRGKWTDGEEALIALLDPDRSDDRTAAKRFVTSVDDWQALSDEPTVATVYDVGVSPSPWVAYHAGERSAERLADALSLDSRLRVIEDIAAAATVAAQQDVYATEITPGTVRIRSHNEPARAALAGWGIERAVRTAFDDRRVTPYTAPEQLAGAIATTTPVYQLGTVAYRLLCGREPFRGEPTLPNAIRNGTVRPASDGTGLPSGVDAVFRRAMATDPKRRYASPEAFADALADTLR
ncbi:hypothetical protein Harman_18060 [Haloarcula mannanilytica]|uniref:Protein kinase domain-containing protein n=1 Tax=Haloarcula mannanilytica TaxID=2509225 RepID=A0A4C2EHA3_9EURY|nr:hypothetical protein [Haloarcula mannanilytica]GCF13871.1 hypothetical protein Harman_18060 [Haloarcula mannanilytica]